MQQPADILKENERLRIRLGQAEEVVRAFRGEDAEALVVQRAAAEANLLCNEVLAQVADAVIAVDESDRIIYLNAAAERLYGLAASDALGRPQADVFTTRWVTSADEAAAVTALREHGEWYGEDVHVVHDGRELSVECRITAQKDDEGQPNGRVAVIREVSKRVQHEKRVLVSEIRYRRLFEAAHDGILIVDPSTRKIIDANPFMIKLLGYSLSELIGMEIFEIGLFSDAKANKDMFQTLKATGQIRYENLPLQTEDGALRDVEVVANRYDENGNSVIQFNVRDITERKQAQKALADSDNRFRLALENSPITVFEQDLDLRYTWIYNPKLGYAANSVLGTTDAELMEAAVARHLTTIKRGVLETGQSVNREVTVAAPGKAGSHFDLTVEPRRGPDGQIEGIICTAVDITERKHAAAVLQASETRYRTLIDATSAVTWSCLPSGLHVDAQPTWMTFTGQSTAEMLGMSWTSALHPDDAENARARWADAVADNLPYHNEVRIRYHDGEWRWMRVHSVPICREGVVNEWFGMCVDISERKKAEQAMHDSEARLSRILNQSPAGIVQTDAGGRAVSVNDRWCKMFGYSKEEMLGMSVIDLTHPSSVEATLRSLGNLAKGGPDFQIEKNYRRKDGVMLRCSSNVAALRDAEGNYQGLLAVVLDMTERMDAEDQLREHNRQNQFLLELSDCLRTAADATAAMSAAAELFSRHCGLPLAQYLLIDPDGDRFNVSGRYSDGWLPPALQQSGRLSDHGPGWGPQFHNGESVFSDDHNDRPEADANASQAIGIRSGSAIPLLRNGRLVAMFTTASPEPRRWTTAEKALQHEVAERTWAAVERAHAEERLQIAHDTFRNLIDRSPFGTYIIDADFRLMQISDGGKKAFANVRPLIGRDFAEVVRAVWPDPFSSEVIAHFRHTLATGEPFKAVTNERRADMEATEAYDWKIERVILPDGRPGVVCHFYDFSEKQQQEDRIKLLMGEVNHRSKNMLGLIQAIARQTVKTQPENFLEVFGQRVRALSANQDLLVKGDWKSVQLDELVRSQLAHFGGEHDGRITIDGPLVQITASASQTLGMAVHELATNAAKFGALSNGSGRVVISWNLQSDVSGQEQFAMSWIESGGPPVAKPVRLGFGSTVIDGMLKMSLGCDAEVDFAPTGLVWRIGCPAAGLIESDVGPLPRPNGTAPSQKPAPVSGRRILVVEDEPLIAMDFSQTLSEADYVVIGPANSVARALALLAQFGCDAAVLDVNLGTETSELVARELIRLGTPFVATSGYSREQLPGIMQAAPLLGKPVSSAMLIAEVERSLIRE